MCLKANFYGITSGPFSLASRAQALALASKAALTIFLASPSNARKIIKLITVIITN